MKLSFSEIEGARGFLREAFNPTPLVFAKTLSTASARVHLKVEVGLPTGSFKVRGALYALQAALGRGPVKELVAASTGNHGAAVAYAAQKMRIPAAIFLPSKPNPVKRDRIAKLGARIVETGSDISHALEASRNYAHEHHAFLLDDSTSDDVPVGAASIGCEIVEQQPNVTEIWVPMGDTALIRAVAFAAKHLRPSVRIVGVQAETAPSYYLSWKKGEVVTTATCLTIADGLATRTPTAANVADIRELVDEIYLVTEDEMLGAIRHLRECEGVLAEPAGAATTAAWMNRGGVGEVALVVSGGNIAEEVLRRL